MDRADFDAASRLLEDALSLPPEAREQFVAASSGSDEELRQRVSALLSDHSAAERYFDAIERDLVLPAAAALGGSTADILPGQTVSHYRVLEFLGSGGMGVVFKALDLRLERFVALKFLPSHLSADEESKKRFLAEAQSASVHDHPNIAVVYDIGETDAGQLFIAMAYYDGETLERRIEQAPLPVPEALRVAREIGAALAAAHGRGIIHRDVKPSNVLITREGTVKLLDFGIARLAHSRQSGRGAGTLAYMSPEQIRGIGTDHRTDIWSLGVVLYELLTKARPFDSYGEQAAGAIVNRTPLPVDRLDPTVSAELARIIDRCLVRNPDDRYQRIEDLVADLDSLQERASSARTRRLLRYSGVAALVGLLAAGGLFVQRAATEREAAARESLLLERGNLVVLPLALSAGSEDAYLAEGITTELIAQLSKFPSLRLIAPSSSAKFNRQGQSAAEIGREFGVRSLLEGSLQRKGEDFLLTLRLIDTKLEQRLWTATYTTRPEHLQHLNREIARRVGTALGADMQTGESRDPPAALAADPETYMLYLKGRHRLSSRAPGSVFEARDDFQRALERNPSFAGAWSGLADAYGELGVFAALPAADVYPRSRAAAERALQLDPDLSEAHVSLGRALSYHYWDFDAASRHFRRATELNPSYAEAYRLQAENLRNRSRFDEALIAIRQAEEHDPLSSTHQLEHGIILYMAGRYDEAISRFERILDVDPGFVHTNFFLALVYVQKKEFAEALQALVAAEPGMRPLDIRTLRAYIDGVTGRRAEARREIDRRLSEEDSPSPWHLAVIHVGLGEHDRAVELLERARSDRAWEFRMLPAEPLFTPLRAHPGFVALVESLR